MVEYVPYFTHKIKIVQPEYKEVRSYYRWLVCYGDWSGIIAAFSASVSVDRVREFANDYQAKDKTLSPLRIYDTAHSVEVDREKPKIDTGENFFEEKANAN